MAECPNCGVDQSHEDLELVESYSTQNSTYAFLECPDCESAFDYSTWDAFYAIYD